MNSLPTSALVNCLGLLAVLVATGLVVGIGYLLYWLATLPWRRQERARLFLEILELGLSGGVTAEEAIRGACETHDRSIPVRMHWVSWNYQRGMPLEEALNDSGGFLPPDTRATLAWGIRHGQLAEAVRLSREGLEARPDASRGGRVAVGTLLVLPGSTLLVFAWLAVFVFPRMVSIAVDMDVSMSSGLTGWMFANGWKIAAMAFAVKLAFCGAVFGRTAGHWLGKLPCFDWLDGFVPWHRQRTQRRFAQLLAMGLDLGVGESEALAAAAAGTGNSVWQRRATVATNAMARGTPLDEAVASIDPTAEFRWRLATALRRPRRTMDSIRGWLEDLEARAERNESMAAQAFFSFVVLVNAAMVGLGSAAVFALLLAILEKAGEA
jgi:type II secretory pathway component PulF